MKRRPQSQSGSCALSLDAYAGKTHVAPGNAVYRFNEMKAACADIAERWPVIKPPRNAVL
jgi:hypothetical protein